jgi:hypothetical protein
LSEKKKKTKSRTAGDYFSCLKQKRHRKKDRNIWILSEKNLESILTRMTVIRNFMSRPRKKQLSLYRRHLGSTALMRLELQRIMDMLSVAGKLFEVAPSRQQKRKIKRIIAKLLLKYHELDAPPPTLRTRLSDGSHHHVCGRPRRL